MSTLTITKKTNLVWLHEPSDKLKFILGKFTFSIDGDYFQIIETGQSKRNKYRFSDITIVDEINSQTFSSFANIVELSEKLAELGYLGFDIAFTSGVISVNGNTGIVVLNGTNINVTNPVTSSLTSLNQALSDILASGGGGSQDLDQTLANGSTALDKSITLDSTPDASFDIYKTVLYPGFTVHIVKATEDSITYTSALSERDLVFDDGANTSVISSTIDVNGNIVNGFVRIPPTAIDGETIATREWVDTQAFEQSSNKATTMTGNTTSNVLYLTAKAIYDWAVGLFYTKTEVDNLLANKETKSNGEVLSSAKSLTNTTSAQAIFNSSISADANSSYLIRGEVDFSGLSNTSSTLAFSLLGTATISSFNIDTLAVKASGATAPSLTSVTSNGTVITNSSAITVARVIFEGIIRVTGAGTIIPAIAFSAATGTMQTETNSFFTYKKIGSDTITTF